MSFTVISFVYRSFIPNKITFVKNCLTPAKSVGNFTLVDTTGRSIVDYMIASSQLLELVKDFVIINSCPDSDHYLFT